MIKEFYNENHNIEKIIPYEIFTDGSCKGGRFGGWAFTVTHDSHCIYYTSGIENPSTNQRMELTAAAEALEYISTKRRPHDLVILYSDSAYLINCYSQKWYEGWLRNGWTNSKGQSVSNKELWERIIPYFQHWWFSFQKVKGHADNFWNNKCDEMAQAAAEKCKTNWRLTNG